MTKYWVIAPFDSESPEIWQRVWAKNLRQGFISIGWRAIGNVSQRTPTQIVSSLRKAWPEKTEKGAQADFRALRKFWDEIKEGHIVVARRGRKCIAAIGTVQSKPYYDPNKAKASFSPQDAYPNHIDVRWHDEPRDVQFDRQVFGMQTIHSLTKDRFDALLAPNGHANASLYPDELTDEKECFEGGYKKVIVNAYERSEAARSQCLNTHGYRCTACEMLFAEVYGEIGINFIHVHHNKPLATRSRRYKINPVEDLTPVCPNCHAMLHRTDPPLSIQQLRSMLNRRRR